MFESVVSWVLGLVVVACGAIFVDGYERIDDERESVWWPSDDIA